jgi:hypothetical protein
VFGTVPQGGALLVWADIEPTLRGSDSVSEEKSEEKSDTQLSTNCAHGLENEVRPSSDSFHMCMRRGLLVEKVVIPRPRPEIVREFI